MDLIVFGGATTGNDAHRDSVRSGWRLATGGSLMSFLYPIVPLLDLI